MTRFLLLSDSCGFVAVGRSLWQEDGFVIYNAVGPRQRSYSRFRGTRDHILLSQIRDFLFVASYEFQDYGGGIRPHLHTGYSLEWTKGTLL
jgi:hypothetical protein